MGGAVGVWGTRTVIQSLYNQRALSVFSAGSQKCSQWVVDFTRFVPVTGSVPDFHEQNLKERVGVVTSGLTSHCISDEQLSCFRLSVR